MSRTRLIFIAILLAAGAVVAYERISAAQTPPAPGNGARPHYQQQGGGNRNGNAPGQGAGRGIAVVTAVAETGDIPIGKESVGWAEPMAAVAVRPQISGVIVEQPAVEGQTVKPGDVLFKLDDRAIQATIAKDEANIAKDQSTLDQAKADLERDRTLLASKLAITQQQFDNQQALVNATTAQVQVDQANLKADQVQQSYTVITAPLAGRLGVINYTLGNYVQPAATNPLVTITQIAQLRVSFTAPERDLGAYRAALAGTPPAIVRARDPESGRELGQGTLSFVDSTVDAASGTVTLKANFDNADQALWPGQYVRVATELGVQKGVTTVPLVAIQQNNEGSFVFLVKPDKSVTQQKVTIASTTSDEAVVASGISPGDHVVVEGQLKLTNGSHVTETVRGGPAADARPQQSRSAS
jgi:multidrug efflux system membrane fusion protein